MAKYIATIRKTVTTYYKVEVETEMKNEREILAMEKARAIELAADPEFTEDNVDLEIECFERIS